MLLTICQINTQNAVKGPVTSKNYLPVNTQIILETSKQQQL